MNNIGITDTVKHLLIINVIMFVGTITIGDGQLFNDWFSMHFPKSDMFKPWQIVTHMFMHGGTMHILFNMFALWMFGTAVEQRLGGKKFLFIYISAGLGAVLFQLGYYYYDFLPLLNNVLELGLSSDITDKIINLDITIIENGQKFLSGEKFQNGLLPILSENNVNTNIINQESFNNLFSMTTIAKSTMVGASGCIMGILVAFGMMNPDAKLMLIFLPIPIKAKYFIPGIIILDIISALTGQSFFSPSNTAFAAHVGGAFIGFIIMWYWRKTQFNKNRWN